MYFLEEEGAGNEMIILTILLLLLGGLVCQLFSLSCQMFFHITIDFFANLALALTSVALTTRLRSLRVAKRIVGAQISGKGGKLGENVGGWRIR